MTKQIKNSHHTDSASGTASSKTATGSRKNHPAKVELCRQIAVAYTHKSVDEAVWLLCEFESMIRVECAAISMGHRISGKARKLKP